MTNAKVKRSLTAFGMTNAKVKRSLTAFGMTAGMGKTEG
jgi:hypothetical protein